jgi:putative ABC transport system permease protein
LGIAIVRGRSFRPDETRRSAPVALVNETLATREWGEADPVGRTITVRKAAQDRSDFGEEVALTVVGVASDTRSFGPAMPPPPAVYVPIPIAVWSHMYVVVKTDGDDAMRVIPDLRGALLEVDASLPLAGPGFVHRLQPMERYVDRGLGEQRLNAAVLGTFATVAFVLAAIGVFGIVAYLAVQRRREFGLRMSLGAQPRDVLRLVVSGGLRVVLLGTLLGLAAAAFMTRLLRGVLFGVAPGDVRSFALAAGLFILAGIIASVIPAARAARLQPADVLRED